MITALDVLQNDLDEEQAGRPMFNINSSMGRIDDELKKLTVEI